MASPASDDDAEMHSDTEYPSINEPAAETQDVTNDGDVTSLAEHEAAESNHVDKTEGDSSLAPVDIHPIEDDQPSLYDWDSDEDDVGNQNNTLNFTNPPTGISMAGITEDDHEQPELVRTDPFTEQRHPTGQSATQETESGYEEEYAAPVDAATLTEHDTYTSSFLAGFPSFSDDNLYEVPTIIIQYYGESYSLVEPLKGHPGLKDYEDLKPLFDDIQVAHKPLIEVLELLRKFFEIGAEYELVLHFPDMKDFEMGEVQLQAGAANHIHGDSQTDSLPWLCTMRALTKLYNRFCYNDGESQLYPLVVDLTVRPKAEMIFSYIHLVDAASTGESLSAFSWPQDQSSETHDNNVPAGDETETDFINDTAPYVEEHDAASIDPRETAFEDASHDTLSTLVNTYDDNVEPGKAVMEVEAPVYASELGQPYAAEDRSQGPVYQPAHDHVYDGHTYESSAEDADGTVAGVGHEALVVDFYYDPEEGIEGMYELQDDGIVSEDGTVGYDENFVDNDTTEHEENSTQLQPSLGPTDAMLVEEHHTANIGEDDDRQDFIDEIGDEAIEETNEGMHIVDDDEIDTMDGDENGVVKKDEISTVEEGEISGVEGDGSHEVEGDGIHEVEEDGSHEVEGDGSHEVEEEEEEHDHEEQGNPDPVAATEEGAQRNNPDLFGPPKKDDPFVIDWDEESDEADAHLTYAERHAKYRSEIKAYHSASEMGAAESVQSHEETQLVSFDANGANITGDPASIDNAHLTNDQVDQEERSNIDRAPVTPQINHQLETSVAGNSNLHNKGNSEEQSVSKLPLKRSYETIKEHGHEGSEDSGSEQKRLRYTSDGDDDDDKVV